MSESMFKEVETLYEKMVETRRYLHQYPELSFQETETAAYIADTYESLGIPFQKNVGGNGVIATIQGGRPGRTVALRADFDALPIQEENTHLPYRSRNDGVMHACGHDGHTAELLGLAEAVWKYKEELPGTMVLVHQPAEEITPGGAKPLLETGALDHVDAVFGTHLWTNTEYGTIETARGPFMAGADAFEITVKGKGGHGAQPHQTKDAIVIASDIVASLQQVVARRIDPLKTAVVTVGTIQAGKAFNIIADQAELSGTVRTFESEVQETIREEMERITRGICEAAGADYHFSYNIGYPPVINHEDEADLVLKEAPHAGSSLSTREVDPSMAGEDFSYYLQKKPGAFYFTGAKLPEHDFPHHHPKFDFDERAMLHGAKTLLQVFLSYQHKYSS
ncbi:M20 family metallopeptidase [Salimicrobium humidisoli]|uniref:Peptidase M20 n=1 Tax=Salimicrobium humidisoli TaxID=2029857 RepID=A0ABX4HP57_9BACI|nr:M20 family metallopeptidase [Salimicrobium humidisoli]PBB04614.1 peptidase M20 [Salimicrobium humidisoli]